jgi:hypothetical protein
MIYSTTTRIEFQDILSAYDFIVAGNVLYVYVGAVEWIKYIPPESPNSATLVFRDGEAELLLTGLNSMTLAGVSVPTTLGPIVATLSPTTSGGDILWHITAVASSLEPTATIPWDSWTDPQTLSINGISAAEVTVYTRDVPSAAPTGGTYSFGAAVPLVAVPLSSGDPVTWSAEVPDDDGSPLYVSKAVVTSASGTTATPIAVWSTPAIMASSGGGSSTATPTSDGLMSKEDKVKLDNSPAVYITESYIPIRAAAAIFLTQGANEGHILAATNKHLYKSTDGGQTWGTAPLASFGQAVWKVKLYEDVAGNLFYSISGGTTALPEAQAGLFRSTDDGANWTRVIGPATETMSAAEYSDTSWNIGDYVVPTTRNYMVYKVTTGGTSIAEPTWPAIKGQTVTSGAVVFECQGTLDISAGQFVWDIEQADNGTLFATIYTLGAGVNYRGTILLKSSNGINWTDATTAIMNVPWRAHGHVLAKSSDGDLWLTLSENQVPKTVWSSNTAYTVQSKVTNPSNANQMFRCLKPGTSGGSAPSWVTSSIGVQTNDGSVVWDYLGNPDWSNSSPLVMVSVDNGVNWTVDLNFNTSMKDGESTTGMFAFSATELLPLASGELLLVIERGGWGDIYRRATNGTYTRVRHAPQPLDTYGLYDAEPLTYDINDNINTPSFPTDYWTSNTYGLVSVNGVVIAFLGNESGYLISLDDGLTWQKRQLAQQMSPGGFFGASNLYGDRIIGIYRDDAGTGGFWNATANYSNAIVLDITTAATISVIPLPPDPIPKGAWHDHADGAGAVIPLAGLGSDVLALLEAGGGAWTYDPDEHTVILTTITDFVGIGTDTPTTPIHVVSTTVAPLLLERSSSVTTDVTHCAAFLNRDTTNNNSTGFTFNSVDSGGTAFIGAAFYAKFTEHANGSESANFHIETQISGNRITRLLIDSAGTKVTGKLETTEGIKFADTTVQTTAATPYTLPKASATNLGGVYVDPGYGIKIDSAGIISANNDTTGTSTSESLPAAASTVKAINDKLNAASLTATYLPRWSGTLFENSQIISNTYGVGINSASTGYALEVNSAANAANVVQAYNTNTGASASSQIVSKSDSALLAINTYSSGRTATRYGITGAGYADIVSTIGNGLLIGTNTLAKPIVFGTNSLERLRITSDGMTRFSNQATAPANNAAGTVGDMIVDAANGYVYFCTGLGGTSNWKRIAMSTY